MLQHNDGTYTRSFMRPVAVCNTEYLIYATLCDILTSCTIPFQDFAQPVQLAYLQICNLHM